jgi:hypothetical protein
MTEPASDGQELDLRRPYLRVLIHALNQPLTAIVNFAEAATVAAGKDPDPRLAESLAAARTESRRAVAIARELSGALGRSGPQPRRMHPNRVLEELAPDLPREAGTRVRLELDRGAGAAAGDAFTLRMALLALARGGAAALGSADATAVLRSRALPGGVQVELFVQADDAPAADPAHHGDLFADPALALARASLVEEGGSLVVEAPDARTLRFVIHLPEA